MYSQVGQGSIFLPTPYLSLSHIIGLDWNLVNNVTMIFVYAQVLSTKSVTKQHCEAALFFIALQQAHQVKSHDMEQSPAIARINRGRVLSWLSDQCNANGCAATAARLGVSYGYIYDLVRGHRNPGPKILYGVAALAPEEAFAPGDEMKTVEPDNAIDIHAPTPRKT